jgi:hypothetical protein
MHLIGFEFANIVIIVALVVAGCLVSYVSSQHVLKEASENARRQLELRLDGITHAIADLEVRVAELTRINEELAATARAATASAPRPSEVAHPSGAAAQAVPKSEEEIAPEILAVIAAAVTSYLGKKVRIRSAKMLQSPYEIVNPWAQQGRVSVQASHALRSWGHSDEPRGRIGTGVRH